MSVTFLQTTLTLVSTTTFGTKIRVFDNITLYRTQLPQANGSIDWDDFHCDYQMLFDERALVAYVMAPNRDETALNLTDSMAERIKEHLLGTLRN